MKKHTISGPISTWKVFGHSRRFSVVTVPYEVAYDAFRPAVYNGQTGQGEQREVLTSHVTKLRREIETGNFTPTPVGVGLSKAQRTRVVVDEEQQLFHIDIESNSRLKLTDGHHRFEAIGAILNSLSERMKKAANDDEKKILGAQIEEVYQLPITAMIHIDGDPQLDFLNLQLGRAPDASHLMTMRIRRNVGSCPEMALALDFARGLANADAGPYAGQIRFDSRGKMPIPISTLCAKGTSDQSTSLIGLAKVAGKMEVPDVVALVSNTYQRLKEECPQVFEYGRVLTPIGLGGTKGSATMFIGMVMCIAYDIAKGRPPRLAEAAKAANETLSSHIERSFTSADKRALIGAFAKNFFETSNEEKHCDIPIDLLKLISPGAFGCSPLSKDQKASTAAEKPQEDVAQHPATDAEKNVAAPKGAKAKSPKKEPKTSPKATKKAKKKPEATEQMVKPQASSAATDEAVVVPHPAEVASTEPFTSTPEVPWEKVISSMA